MDDLLVDRRHPLSAIVASALRDARHDRDPTPKMMARAVRAVLDAVPDMTITEAYGLVDRLWVR